MISENWKSWKLGTVDTKKCAICLFKMKHLFSVKTNKPVNTKFTFKTSGYSLIEYQTKFSYWCGWRFNVTSAWRYIDVWNKVLSSMTLPIFHTGQPAYLDISLQHRPYWWGFKPNLLTHYLTVSCFCMQNELLQRGSELVGQFGNRVLSPCHTERCWNFLQ